MFYVKNLKQLSNVQTAIITDNGLTILTARSGHFCNAFENFFQSTFDPKYKISPPSVIDYSTSDCLTYIRIREEDVQKLEELDINKGYMAWPRLFIPPTVLLSTVAGYIYCTHYTETGLVA